MRQLALILPLAVSFLHPNSHAEEPHRIPSGKPEKRAPVPVIFDTDITGDVDDVLALAMLHTLADRGACEILAVTISKQNPLAAPLVDAVNTFYGRPDIPIGVARNAPPRESSYLKLAEERAGDDLRYPRTIGVSEEPKPAVEVLKQALQSAADGSVAVVQVGLATNVAELLASEGGTELISKKANHLSVMAGAFETIDGNNHYLEANVRNHVPSMQALARQWPAGVPIVWSGFEIGIAAPFPRESIASDFGYVKHHPVREAYLLHSGPAHDRPTWDLTSVLYSVFPDRGFFDLSPAGRVTVEDDGFTGFVPAAKGRDRYLIMSPVQAGRVQEALVHLVAQPPLHLDTRNIARNAPVKLIFDTDMGNDVDDAMALAMIHSLEKRGACELLAVTSTKDHPLSAAFIDAVNTFYGRPGVPIGVVRNGATPEAGKFNGLAENYPHDLRSGADAPEAVSLLRKTLAAQPDGSVNIAQVGFFTNLARLLESPGDDISPLNGVDLVKAKVRELAIMAGAFQTIHHNNRYKEYNVIKDIPSARKFAETWPSPIVWSGFEIGIAAAYPWDSVMNDFAYVESHPIAEAYLAYVPSQPHDRPTWDLTAVLHAVYPGRGYFDLSPRGRVVIEENGFSTFHPAGKPETGRDRFLIMNELQAARVREAFVQLTSEPPRK